MSKQITIKPAPHHEEMYNGEITCPACNSVFRGPIEALLNGEITCANCNHALVGTLEIEAKAPKEDTLFELFQELRERISEVEKRNGDFRHHHDMILSLIDRVQKIESSIESLGVRTRSQAFAIVTLMKRDMDTEKEEAKIEREAAS